MRHSVRFAQFSLSLSLLAPFATSALAQIANTPNWIALTQERVSRGRGWSHVVITVVDSTIDRRAHADHSACRWDTGSQAVHHQCAGGVSAKCGASRPSRTIRRYREYRSTVSCSPPTNVRARPIGAAAVRQQLGYDGAGVGCCHHRLGSCRRRTMISDPVRVISVSVRFVDLVQGQPDAVRRLRTRHARCRNRGG